MDGREILLEEITKERIQDCIPLYLEVFNSEPWNDRWTHEQVHRLFSDYLESKGALGYAGSLGGSLCSVCIGRVENWWNGVNFFVEEYFVGKAMQQQGIGAAFLHEVEILLKGKGIESISLLTARGTPAEQFYRKNGFAPIKSLVYMKKNFS